MDVLFSGDGSGGAQRACGGGLLEVAAQDQDERVVLVATKLTTASGGWAASGAADFRSLTLSGLFYHRKWTFGRKSGAWNARMD